MTNDRLFITGASGVVGAALLQEMRGEALTCLTHRTPVIADNVESLRGDLTQPRLGLDVAGYDELAASTKAIVHCAAVVDFDVDPATVDELNVQGTRQVLALARDAGIPLYYISTAFIYRAGDTLSRRGGNQASVLSARVIGPDAYLESKVAAEQLVRDSGVPATIVRPSVVSGDSRTGAIARKQGFHGVLGALSRGLLPLMPIAADCLVDFLPQDVVAAAIASLVRSGATGQEHWLTAGSEALTAAEVLQTCEQVMDAAGAAVRCRPRLVDVGMVDRLIRPVFLADLAKCDRDRFDGLMALGALFSSTQPLPSSTAQIVGKDAVTKRGLIDALCTTVQRHWAATPAAPRPAVA